MIVAGVTDDLPLPSPHAVPTRLRDAGFTVHDPTIDEAAVNLISGITASTTH